MLPRKPPRALITSSIQTLIRTFPSQTVRVTRVTGWTMNAAKMRQAPIESVMYLGEALFVEAGGQISQLGLGMVETKDPHLLVAGVHPIHIGDRLTVRGVPYEVTSDSNRWGAFGIYKLKQVTQP